MCPLANVNILQIQARDHGQRGSAALLLTATAQDLNYAASPRDLCCVAYIILLLLFISTAGPQCQPDSRTTALSHVRPKNEAVRN